MGGGAEAHGCGCGLAARLVVLDASFVVVDAVDLKVEGPAEVMGGCD